MTGLLPFYSDKNSAKLAKAAADTAKALVSGGFTSAEIRYSFAKFWEQEDNKWTFKKNYPLNPADFIPHIAELRRLQQLLVFPLQLWQVTRLVREFTGLTFNHFGVCGYGVGAKANEMMYRYRAYNVIQEQVSASERLSVGAQPVGSLYAAYTVEVS